ncbi:hypothetical protein EGW08_019079 [Elysia chlorotica]|uniref:DUF6451 domain-containing protein n=1 Tax=Elysia chlorotica TaxID=188477 RepID=A0A3S1BRH8_ELYCH|nr:hypothetical protein EGW08_019079 [Elysia chlorotica]
MVIDHYFDDTSLLSLLFQKQQYVQEKLYHVAEEAGKTRLQINIRRTAAMRINNKQANALRLHGENIEKVDKFVFLGSVVSKDGGTDEESDAESTRLDTPSSPSNQSGGLQHYRPVRNKIRIFNTNVKSVLLYGSEIWSATKISTTKLQTFTSRCLINIVNLRWPEVVSNKELWGRTKKTLIETEIKKA